MYDNTSRAGMRKFVENLSVFVEIIWKLTLVILNFAADSYIKKNNL